MYKSKDYYPDCPEALIVGLARTGDREAFAELVGRYQSSIRGFLRRCSGDPTLSDDLAQQVFLQVWLKIRTLKNALAFGAWLKRLAVTVWLQHVRKHDALRGAEEVTERSTQESVSEGLDLDGALALLPAAERLCVVLSYHEGLSHTEIVEATGYPLGTVKSHINRGAARLRESLAAYQSNGEYP